MDAGLIFALVWSVLALAWGGFLFVKRNELARASQQQGGTGPGASRRWALSSKAVGWAGAVFVVIGILTLVFGLVGATR